MRYLTALEIASNYPDNILITATQNTESTKWLSQMYLLRNGDIHKLMLSFDANEKFQGWDSKEIAIDTMNELAQAAIKSVLEKNNGIDGTSED